jgi:hypothetical protein
MSWNSNDITLLEVKCMIAAQRKSMDKVRLMMLSHKDLIDHVRRNLSKLCDNSPVRFDLDKITDGMWLKDIAFYLAVTAKKFSDYGDIDYDSVSLWHNAKRIHGLLGDALEEKLISSECF